MPKKKTISRKKQLPFKKTLFVTRAVLGAKLRERSQLLDRLKMLNHDIPYLQNTVAALEAQLSGKDGALTRVQFPAPSKDGSESDGSSLAGSQSGQRTSLEEIPPEIRAQLPPEDLSQFGSHYGDGPAPKEDFLPEITGKPVLPEKP